MKGWKFNIYTKKGLKNTAKKVEIIGAEMKKDSKDSPSRDSRIVKRMLAVTTDSGLWQQQKDAGKQEIPFEVRYALTFPQG